MVTGGRTPKENISLHDYFGRKIRENMNHVDEMNSIN
jgi:hypothetical protein